MGMLGCAHTARLQRACELSLGGGVCGLTCLPSMGEEALGSRLTNAPDMGLNRRQGLQPGLCRGLRSASSFSFLLSVSLSLPALLQLPGACSRTCCVAWTRWRGRRALAPTAAASASSMLWLCCRSGSLQGPVACACRVFWHAMKDSRGPARGHVLWGKAGAGLSAGSRTNLGRGQGAGDGSLAPVRATKAGCLIAVPPKSAHRQRERRGRGSLSRRIRQASVCTDTRPKACVVLAGADPLSWRRRPGACRLRGRLSP